MCLPQLKAQHDTQYQPNIYHKVTVIKVKMHPEKTKRIIIFFGAPRSVFRRTEIQVVLFDVLHNPQQILNLSEFVGDSWATVCKASPQKRTQLYKS